MTAITIPNTFLPSTTISSTAMNQNFSTVATGIQASLALDGTDTMTGQLRGLAGTAGAPGYSFGVDLDVGMFRKAANELGFATAGTLGFHVDASQKLWAAGAVDVAGALSVVGGVTLNTALPIASGGTGATSASAAFSALKQTADETNTGVVDLATDAEIRAATTGAHAIMASDLESAAALVTITDGATITPDWDAFINGQITLAGNRTLNVPTNLQAGTWRTIWIQGNDGTDRTITLGAGYLGPNVAVWNALTFNSSTKRYIMSIFALNSSNAVILGAPLGPF
jgi:hypothetical protein